MWQRRRMEPPLEFWEQRWHSAARKPVPLASWLGGGLLPARCRYRAHPLALPVEQHLNQHAMTWAAAVRCECSH